MPLEQHPDVEAALKKQGWSTWQPEPRFYQQREYMSGLRKRVAWYTDYVAKLAGGYAPMETDNAENYPPQQQPWASNSGPLPEQPRKRRCC